MDIAVHHGSARLAEFFCNNGRIGPLERSANFGSGKTP